MLSSKQKAALRALAHHKKPVVQVGTAGVTEAVVAKADGELEFHELIKVKVGKESEIDVDVVGADLASKTRSDVAQVIGRTVVLYRARAKKPTIKLPKADMPIVPDELAD